MAKSINTSSSNSEPVKQDVIIPVQYNNTTGAVDISNSLNQGLAKEGQFFDTPPNNTTRATALNGFNAYIFDRSSLEK